MESEVLLKSFCEGNPAPPSGKTADLPAPLKPDGFVVA